MSSRFLSFLFLLSACSASCGPGVAVELDAPVLPNAGATDAPRCDGCLTSERRVVGEGLGPGWSAA